MNDETQLLNFRKLFEALGLYDAPIMPIDKYPEEIAQEIVYFRKYHGSINFDDVKFYTYDLKNMVISIAILRAIKDTWETNNSELSTTHEVTLSVYPAMDMSTKELNFYFIPTWIKKGGFSAGTHIKEEIIDFVGILSDVNSPYLNEKGYIYDLGSSCP